jgi:hypothetical protein
LPTLLVAVAIAIASVSLLGTALMGLTETIAAGRACSAEL